MVDILDEARNEWKQQQMVAYVKKYAAYLLAFAVVLIAGVVGWQWWQGREERAARAASIGYFEALQAVQAGADEQGAALLATAAQSGTGYAPLAALLQAGMLAGSGKTPEALKAYEAISDDGSADRAIRDLAALHAAQLKLDGTDQQAQAQAYEQLDELAKKGRPWHFSALEVKAFGKLASKDYASARESFTLITTAPDAPASLRQHAADMLLHIAYLEAK